MPRAREPRRPAQALHFLTARARTAGIAFFRDDALSLAAAIAFYTSLSFAPLVLLLTTTGDLLGDRTKYELLGLLSDQLGPRAADVAQDVVEASARESQGQWWRRAISTAGLLLTASAVFAQLQSALNHIWRAPPGHVASVARGEPGWRRAGRSVWAWLRRRLLSMGMVLVVLLILLVSLVLSAALGALNPNGEAIARTLELVGSFLIAALLFAAIFRVLPDAHVAWKHACIGGLITSGLFNVGKLALALYIERSGVGEAYGETIGGLIALLVWVYYSSAVLLLGAEATWALSDQFGKSPRETDPTTDQPRS